MKKFACFSAVERIFNYDEIFNELHIFHNLFIKLIRLNDKNLILFLKLRIKKVDIQKIPFLFPYVSSI